MKQKKSKKYFDLLKRMEEEMDKASDGVCSCLWELERVGEFNSFSILAYNVKYKVVLLQNQWDGSGLFVYLPDGENTFKGSGDKIKQLFQ